MYLRITIILLIAFNFNSLAQNIVLNPSFETNTAECRNPTIINGSESYDEKPFFHNEISNWLAASGTPQVNKVGCVSPTNDTYSENTSAFLGYNSTNMESIYQNISLAKDESYSFVVTAKGNGVSRILVALTNGLSNTDDLYTSLPSHTGYQLVLDTLLSNSWNIYRINELIVDSSYSQLWIYAMDGEIIVDDIEVYSSCCIPLKLWQNIVNPPSTYVNYFIQAGKAVDTSQNEGAVQITADTEPIIFQAGQTILLEDGFETEVGADFTAQILPCEQTPFQVEVSQIIIDTPYAQAYDLSGQKMNLCYNMYQMTACYGSGNYTYEWLDDYGHMYFSNVTYPISTADDFWLKYQVTDNVTNDIILDSIFVEKMPFIGAFNISWHNIITDDNDGYNDDWIAIDSSRLNEDSFGYNAYIYDLTIVYRWNNELVYSASDTDKISGFAFDEIKWDEDYCENLIQTELFGVLHLENCHHWEDLSFIIYFTCPSSTEHVKLSIDSLSEKLDVLVYPNPATAYITIENSKNMNLKIDVLDVNGSISLSKNINTTTEINMSNLGAGTYHLKIMDETGSVRMVKTIVLVH